MTGRFHLRNLAVCWAFCSILALAQDRQIRLVHGSDVVEVQAVASNVVRIHIQPGGRASPRTLVMDPSFQPTGVDMGKIDRSGATQTLSSPEMRVVLDDGPEFSIQVQDARGKTLATVKSDPQPGRGPQRRGTVIIHDGNEDLYGIHGLEWHDGDALLVSPVVERQSPLHKFYLPPGTWFDYSSGKAVEGGQEMAVSLDANTWRDIPLYVRDGSILPTQPAERGNELGPATALILDVFPSAKRVASFLAYDDDGHSYDYEKGGYFRQEITATRSGRAVNIEIAAAAGVYKARFPSYLLRVHQASASVTSDGQTLTKFGSSSAFESSSEPGWFSTTDRFGAVTEVRIGTDDKRHSLMLAPREP